jgi:hypothetical protein
MPESHIGGAKRKLIIKLINQLISKPAYYEYRYKYVYIIVYRCFLSDLVRIAWGSIWA